MCRTFMASAIPRLNGWSIFPANSSSTTRMPFEAAELLNFFSQLPMYRLLLARLAEVMDD